MTTQEMKVQKKIRKMIIRELKRGTYKEIGNRSNAIKLAIYNSDPLRLY